MIPEWYFYVALPLVILLAVLAIGLLIERLNLKDRLDQLRGMWKGEEGQRKGAQAERDQLQRYLRLVMTQVEPALLRGGIEFSADELKATGTGGPNVERFHRHRPEDGQDVEMVRLTLGPSIGEPYRFGTHNYRTRTAPFGYGWPMASGWTEPTNQEAPTPKKTKKKGKR